ncbi:MAG TPA: CpsD/CapB family tyrosine-protein kinase [bacterium]|nr:CpsD/CapB family tyrosine-protein kinase [bacterium]
MSVIHDALTQLDEQDRSAIGTVFGNQSHAGALSMDLPEQILSDFYDLKEYVRIANLRGKMRILSIVSSLPNEGSTTIAAYLGYLLAGGKKQPANSISLVAAAEDTDNYFRPEFAEEVKRKTLEEDIQPIPSTDRRILLVDTNLREPGVHSMFNLRAEDGLADILESDLPWRKVIKEVSDSNLTVITAGQAHQNPVELIASDHFRQLLSEWRKEFAYVIFDSAPVLTSVEALGLGAIVDGVILVVRAGLTRWDNAQNAKRKLAAAQVNLLGVALNRQRQ